MLSFIPNTSILSNYQTINIPNLKNSIYVTENEHDENYATNLTILLPEGSISSSIELNSIRTMDDHTLEGDTQSGHTLPFSNFQLISGSSSNQESNEIIVPAAQSGQPRGGVIVARDNTGYRMWPIINKFTKPIKTYARRALKYAPLTFNVLNKLVGVCKIASGDPTGLSNILSVPFYEPIIEEAEINTEDVYITIVDETRITDYDNGAFLPFTTFSIMDY